MIPSHLMHSPSLALPLSLSHVAEECVSYCQPSQVKVKMNLETYCLKDYGWCLLFFLFRFMYLYICNTL